jgi:hypothetical protein
MRTAKHSETGLVEIKAQLKAVVEALQRLATKVERASFTIPEWCERHNMSESQYFKLRREGRGPRLMSTGDVGVRISREADVEWIRAREAEADQRKVRMVPAE